VIRFLLPCLAAFALPLSASLPLPKELTADGRFASLSLPKVPASAGRLASSPDPADEDDAPPKPSPVRAAAETPAAPGPDLGPIVELARQGRLDSARDAALRALAAYPASPSLLVLLGKLAPSGPEASEYFKQAVKAAPASPEAEEAYFRLGQYTYATGKYHLAIPYFRDYLRQYPKGVWKDPALYWMGNACLAYARSREEKAAYLDSGEVWFARLLEAAKPGDYYRTLAFEGLAKAKAGKGDREGAWEAAQRALEKAPEEEKPPLLLLAAQTRQGVDRAAEKDLIGRLMAGYPQSPEARYLRKLNAGADTARWKSGSGLPRPVPAPPRDSLAPPAAGGPKASDTSTLPLARAPARAPDTAGKAAAGNPPFTLQCGAFAQAENAAAMAAELSKLGLAPETVARERGGKRIYQVRVGRFATAEEAEAFAREKLKPRRILSQPVPAAP
jgi:cell division protein FtsN